MRLFATVFAFAACLVLAAGAQESLPGVQFGEATLTVGHQKLFVQVARTMPQLERGLMERTSVEPYDGMLFVFDKPQRVAFWMKNTTLPLDIGYFDKGGILREVYRMKPLDTTNIVSQHADILYALELPQGDFRKKGIKTGDKLAFDNAKAVLK